MDPVYSHDTLKHTPALCTHVTTSDDSDASGGFVNTSVPLAIEKTGDSAVTVVSCSDVARTEKDALVAVDGITSHEKRPCAAGTPDAIVDTGTPLRSKSRRTVPLATASFVASHVTERGELLRLMLPARGVPTTRPNVGPLRTVMFTLATIDASWSQRTDTKYPTPLCNTPVPPTSVPGQLTLPPPPGRPVPMTPAAAPVDDRTTDTVTVPSESAPPKPSHDTVAGARRYQTAFCAGAEIVKPTAGGATTVMTGDDEKSVDVFVDVMRIE